MFAFEFSQLDVLFDFAVFVVVVVVDVFSECVNVSV